MLSPAHDLARESDQRPCVVAGCAASILGIA